MVITRHSLQFFKVQFGDTVLAFNPPSKDSSYKSSRFGADIILISINHKDFNGADTLTAGDKEPFVVRGPGEYEIQEVFIQGLPSKSKYGGQERVNTIYLVTLEGMQLCFLGALAGNDLDPQTAEALDEIDILFVPIGGDGAMDPSEAYKFAVKQESKIIIPTHYESDKDEALKKFLKEESSQKKKAKEKLTIKPKDVASKEGEIVVLSKV